MPRPNQSIYLLMKYLFMVLVISSITSCLQNKLLAQHNLLTIMPINNIEVVIPPYSVSDSKDTVITVQIERNLSTHQNYRPINSLLNYPLTPSSRKRIVFDKKVYTKWNYVAPSLRWFSKQNNAVTCTLSSCAPQWDGNN